MDDVTRKRHDTAPDVKLRFEATGVKLPNGEVSWLIRVPQGQSDKWWSRLFADWSRIFSRRGLQN